MQAITVYQFNQSGLYVGNTTADESPRQSGVFLMPANSTDIQPPESWSDDVWPRFNGNSWMLIPKPKITEPMTAEQKLAEFLQNNPDVMNLITPNT
ncbi:phage tail protein [Acinetobacter modestus]|uniref:phage tail protein n=1 Tax=Acinetobacter modestus TaxID=1776740 RepID=UPI001F4ABF0C|nr:phage tail protein [Acinetobacter modestus]MCH7387672.1 phage tail protein [Acinetobacter modestus]